MKQIDKNKVWEYCPECGCTSIENKNFSGEGSRSCKDCGQEWWLDIDYTDTIRTVLQNYKKQVESLKTKIAESQTVS